MSLSEEHIVIRITEADNVGVVTNSSGLNKGLTLKNGTRLSQHIPMGHKVALSNIGTGEKIIRYGQAIGYAKMPIKEGELVNESKISLPEPPDLNSVILTKMPEPEPLKGFNFMGYRNPDGSVATKNVLGIISSVQCVAGFTQYIVNKIKKELLPEYPKVDDVVALNHTYGCGIALNVPSAVIPVRTLQNITVNPNFGGEILILGLGCEKLRPESLVLQNDKHPEPQKITETTKILYMQDESFSGFNSIVERSMKMAEIKLKKLNRRRREKCPVSDLVVGIQCGGSDVFSGITCNPVAGFAADLVVRAGGSVLFSEVSEVRDAVHLLVPRAINHKVGKALLDEMKWYDDYLMQGHADRSANPSPGNIKGGLSNIVEKALGSIAKSGTTPIVDVLGPGEKIRHKGLTFAATPACDFICGTLQVAAGMNLHVFTTGRGTPYGLAMVPVIKVGSNSKLSNRWYDLIDLDAGQVATGEKTIEEMGWELFHFMLDVASGKKKVACDKLGLHNDLVLFNPGPVT